KDEGLAVAARVQGVAGKVKQRVATTRRIAMELKPGGVGAGEAVKDTRAELAGRARKLGDMAQRLSRVKAAAEAAASAARQP
ncbi:MAG TPA: hypothetical protein VFU47_14800, partial [Armatimonadota bacterium]|nr:hypothetical protein [Armatimonadota bacterium]